MLLVDIEHRAPINIKSWKIHNYCEVHDDKHQTPVHLHDKVHDSKSKSEKGENREWISASSSSSKLTRACLPSHQTLALEYKDDLKQRRDSPAYIPLIVKELGLN